MIIVATVLLAIAFFLLILALWRLPGTPERLVALDALSACAIAACLLAAARTKDPAFLDVAIGYASVAFVATISWAHSLGEPKEPAA
jgi:multicomponent Na+:H+ antiporter subunit F